MKILNGYFAECIICHQEIEKKKLKFILMFWTDNDMNAYPIHFICSNTLPEDIRISKVFYSGERPIKRREKINLNKWLEVDP